MTAIPVTSPRQLSHQPPAPQRRATSVAAEVKLSPMVSLRGLDKGFPLRRGWRQMLQHPTSHDFLSVLRNVTLDVQPGEFFGLLGPNGAGKSTIFRTLATLILPDCGDVTVDGLTSEAFSGGPLRATTWISTRHSMGCVVLLREREWPRRWRRWSWLIPESGWWASSPRG